MPPALESLGICATLGNYAGQWTGWNGIPVQLQCDGIREGHIPFETGATIYRVVQEALTNVARHAPSATAVSVVVRKAAGRITVIVEDDGPGFDVQAATDKPIAARGLGLAGIQERAALGGGTLVIESVADIGTTVRMRLPVS